MIAITGCKEHTEVLEVVDEEGSVSEKITIDKVSRQREGLYQGFYPSGQLKEEATYANDTLNGSRTLYYESGSKKVEENYVLGYFHGPFVSYYENGQVNVHGSYLQSEMDGKWTRYYETGELMETTEFRNNEENGPFEEYYKNGRMKAKGMYVNGPYEHGELLLYDEDGELVKKMDCNNGACTTTWQREEKSADVQ